MLLCKTLTFTLSLPNHPEVIIEEAAAAEPSKEPTNDIEMEVLVRVQLEQVVELSILLKGERYSDALRDPASLHYQTLNQQFTDKVRLRCSFCFSHSCQPFSLSILFPLLASPHPSLGL